MINRFQTPSVLIASVFVLVGLAGCQPQGYPPTVSDDTRARLSQALLATGDTVNAAEALRTPASREAEMAPDTLTNAEVLITAGEVDRGMDMAKKALAARRDDRDFALQVAGLAIKADRLADADEIYRRILRSHPDDIDALNGEGVAQAQQGDLSGAAKSLQSALALSPQDVSTRSNLALVMLLKGQNEAALSLFEELDRSDPSPQIAAALLEARHRVAATAAVSATAVAAAPPAPQNITQPVGQAAIASGHDTTLPSASPEIPKIRPPVPPAPVPAPSAPAVAAPSARAASKQAAASSEWSCPAICRLFSGGHND